jgi:hypothetical protein
MKLILAVLAIQVVLKLVGKTTKNNSDQTAVNDSIRHPAEFRLR